jgi:hypothetical protein
MNYYQNYWLSSQAKHMKNFHIVIVYIYIYIYIYICNCVGGCERDIDSRGRQIEIITM